MEKITLDLTPVGCRTPEGQARVKRTLERLEDLRAAVANDATDFIRHREDVILQGVSRLQAKGYLEYQDVLEIREEVRELKDAIARMNDAQEEFMLALAGRPSREKVSK